MTALAARLRSAAAVSLAALALASAPALAESAPAADTVPSEWGRFGIQTDNIDPAVKPGDDFNLYVNGKWVAKTELPADRTRIGSFDMLDELSKTRLRAILEELAAKPQTPGSAEARIADAWRAYMDTDGIERAGLTRLNPG